MTVAWQWRRLVSATWLTAGIGLVATSCSFLFELDANQCSIDTDCQKFEGELPVCRAGLCVAKSGSGGNGGSSMAGSAGAAPADAGAGGVGETGCKSNKECIEANSDQPYVCQEGACIGLITEDCPLVIGAENLKSAAPIIFGAYTLANATDRSVAARNIELVVSEFTREVTGLPGDTKRTLAFVVCNSSFPEVAPGTIDPFVPSLDHLVDTLHVPGILSGLSAKDLEAVYSQRLKDAGTFVISPYEQETELASLSDGGRLWHLLGATVDLAPPFGPLLKRTEQYLRAEENEFFLNLEADDKVRVAIVSANIARETNVSDALLKLPELEGFDVESFEIESALVTDSPNADAVAADLLDFAPNIIVALAGSEFIEGVFPVLEAPTTWGKASTPTEGQSRPIYVLGAAMAPQTWSLYSTKQGDAGGYSTLLDRIVGVTYESATDTELLDEYTARLIRANQDLDDPSVLLGSENVYDAAYLLMYATAAVSGAVPELNGEAIASGMLNLLEGESLDVGPTHMSNVIATLENGGTVGLRLTVGEPNWNKARGTRQGRGSVYCLNNGTNIPDESDLPMGPNLDVLRYNPETNALEEKPLPCIFGF
jgi:hypothetical protein